MESSHGMVAKTSVESTVPCVVTNPNISVTLHEKESGEAVDGTFTASEGFRAALEDRTYVCRGVLDGEVKESQSFNVLSIVGRCLAGEVEAGTGLRPSGRNPVITISPPPRAVERLKKPQARTHVQWAPLIQCQPPPRLLKLMTLSFSSAIKKWQ